jgi:regulator of cell morphogenesis and NO signaling
MRISTHTTIRQIALHVPGSTEMFQQEGIDYCCGADHTLEEACREAQVSVEHIAGRIERLAVAAEQEPQRNWQIEPLFLLTSHIVNQHHEFARREMPRLAQHALQVISVHGPSHPELARIEVLLRAMTREFNLHMMREEQMLFPYIVQLEECDRHSEIPPVPPFGTVENPMRSIGSEHDSAAEMLRELRYLTVNFTPPPDACPTFQRFYAALKAFEADMHEHIHLEDNILFPRALELETNNRFVVMGNV